MSSKGENVIPILHSLLNLTEKSEDMITFFDDLKDQIQGSEISKEELLNLVIDEKFRELIQKNI